MTRFVWRLLAIFITPLVVPLWMLFGAYRGVVEYKDRFVDFWREVGK